MTSSGAEGNSGSNYPTGLRAAYDERLAAMRAAFDATGDGAAACQARSTAVDALLHDLWTAHSNTAEGVCLVALGGYGREQLFPFSDVDLLFCAEKFSTLDRAKDAIRHLSQTLWDLGLRLTPTTRALADCERFSAADPEFSLALLDLRFLTGDEACFSALKTRIIARRTLREARQLAAAAATLTRERHARFGHTLFHLEPSVKDAPGGLRDAHVCAWLAQLEPSLPAESPDTGFRDAVAFLTATRVFLHLRHGRDDNTLDWHAQDEAAARAIGLAADPAAAPRPSSDPAYWMRACFRHARAIERRLARELERTGQQARPSRAILKAKAPPRAGFSVRDGVLDLAAATPDRNPAHDPEIVLPAFGLMAQAGVLLAPASEQRIAAAIPELSANLEDGPRLWARLRSVLTGFHAGGALREMHALGVLELLVPEFHGIDALVIRDAYHRYTVDEHTFVLIDVLHGLAEEPAPAAPEWRSRLRSMLREMPHPDLLFLAALLHDTGKGRASSDHAAASARLATDVCARLELGPYESGLVIRLIESHLEMSAALRRDIFNLESVRVFADNVQTHELLRMLTLFTYADISAVHPDALTPWKAENLWRLSMAAANQLDRSVDQERVHTGGPRAAQTAETVARVLGPSGPSRHALEAFLEGFPERYLRTRSPDAIRQHLLAARGETAATVLFDRRDDICEMTVVTRDRPHLFADLTAALAGWGMDVLTAEAFSNAEGVVVDYFRFLDGYRTLELNPEERPRFVAEMEAVLRGELAPDRWKARRRARRTPPRREVATRIEFDNTASSHSTLMQIVTRDVPGLLRTTAQTLSDFGCSVEVALIDTEGEVAIDVFYLTRDGRKLEDAEPEALRSLLLASIETNAL